MSQTTQKSVLALALLASPQMRRRLGGKASTLTGAIRHGYVAARPAPETTETPACARR